MAYISKMDNSVNVNDVSRIAVGTVFKGEISTPGDIRIDGSFEGKLICKGRVVVGDKAVFKGDVICSNIEFCGHMKGNFYVKETLTLKSGCVVDGDLHVRRLQVELDSKFNGNCHMLEEGEFDKLTGSAAAAKPADEKK